MNRRDFLQRAAMLAGAGMCGPLWAAMKYDRDGVLDLFRLKAKEIGGGSVPATVGEG